MRKAMVLGVLGLAGTLASPAFADEYSGVRLGLNLSSDYMESDYFAGPVADTTPMDQTSANRFGYGVFGGWALNKWFAVEGGLLSGSDFNTDIFPDPSDFDFYDHQNVNLKGGELSAVGTFWIGKKFAIFGRAGVYGYKAEIVETLGFYSDPDSRVVLKVEDNGFEPLFGVGLQTTLDSALVRLEYKMTSIADFRFLETFGTVPTNDDIEINWRNNDISSLSFSIVWTLH